MIRSAVPSDLPRIGALGALLVAEHHSFDPKRFLSPGKSTPAGYASFMGTQLQNPDAIVMVAEEHGAVIGYVYGTVEGVDYMSLRGPAGALQDIMIDPAHRRRGIGQRLLVAMLAALKARGVPRVVLSTAAANDGAQQLFDKAGFRRTMIEMTREMDAG